MVTPLDRRTFLLGTGGTAIASVLGAGTRSRELAEGDSAAGTGPETAAGTRPDAAAVVSQHHLATDAGLAVLADGGTAADAAVAVASALSVVEPWFSSALGGGTWALYYDAEAEEVTSVDGVGPVGSEATPEDYAERGGDYGMHQSIVPGAWDGWMLWLDRYGELDLGDVLAPAITLAREGYPVSPGMESWLDRRADRIAERPDAREIYERNGELVEEGDTVSQEDMADTFEALAEAYAKARDEGRSEAIQAARDYFYRGPLAEAIVEFSDERDGYLTLEDFHEFEAEIVEPISIEWDGGAADADDPSADDEDDDSIQVYQNPPNSQGITQLLALNVLKGFDLDELEPDDADAVHLQAEALKLAFADRYHHVGDPDRVDVPVTELLDDEYAASQRERIETDAAMEWPIDSGLDGERGAGRPLGSEARHTTTFHVIDGDGNAAAVTTSLGAQFQVIGDTGIHLNNRMRMIAVEDDDPNRLTPGYKVRHTSNPYLATRGGEPYILGGNTGVDTQPQGQTQQFLNVVAFGLDAQAAIDRPRFETTAFPATTYPYDVDNRLHLETDGLSDDVIDGLEERGHDVSVGGSYGTANALVIDEDGAVEIGAESRSEVAEGRLLESDED